MNFRGLFSRALIGVVLTWNGLEAAEKPSYVVARVESAPTVDGRLDEPAWVGAPAVDRFQFAWWEGGDKEQTVAKLLWDDDNLYVAFICQDAHIWAEHTQRDSAVYRDDCVEVFTAPDPQRPSVYYNIEMNVLGIFLDQFHPEGPRGEAPEWNSQGVTISTSIVGTLNDDSDRDQYWILEAALPWSNFAATAKHTPPQPGDEWNLNLNRLGGRTNSQFSQWSPSQTERPNFHAPKDFGRVLFSAYASPF
ncbi:MAG: hypothetical protein GKR89_35445 [Candidatus Latescibacteria bacterium]|nr:hypothetical protein [Candidatus Latescibacterota bacterium]